MAVGVARTDRSENGLQGLRFRELAETGRRTYRQSSQFEGDEDAPPLHLPECFGLYGLRLYGTRDSYS